ncbi:hypothetical protein HYV86_04510 [Candidatus Woesearchaeota archaeon]|nr:hypothetical protein [Candidatus Woesearchaeota archaeon]
MTTANTNIIKDQEQILAIHIKAAFSTPGASFFTPDEFPFQLGMHLRPKGTLIDPHQHIPFSNLHNIPAQEFFYLIQGKLEVTLYHNKIKHSIVILESGDALLLNCGHKVVFLEESKMLELKQGPYRGRDVEKEFFQDN